MSIETYKSVSSADYVPTCLSDDNEYLDVGFLASALHRGRNYLITVLQGPKCPSCTLTNIILTQFNMMTGYR